MLVSGGTTPPAPPLPEIPTMTKLTTAQQNVLNQIAEQGWVKGKTAQLRELKRMGMIRLDRWTVGGTNYAEIADAAFTFDA